jgi:hypothetical protein
MNTFFYKIKNALRWSYWIGLLQTIAARLSVAAFGGVALTSELSAIKYTFANEEDRQTYFKLMRQALGIDRDDVEHRTMKRLIGLKKANQSWTQTMQDAVDAVEAWRDSVVIPAPLGVVSRRVVTNAFVAFIVDQLQTETSAFGDFKYHDSGVGTTAENAADTAIETTDGESRATGTQTESAANAYRSVGTISYTTNKAITEHILANDSSAGTAMDRSVFSAINVTNGDSIQFTYTLTFTAGG